MGRLPGSRASKSRMVRRSKFKVGYIPWNKGAGRGCAEKRVPDRASTEESPVASCSSNSSSSPDLANTEPSIIINLWERVDESIYNMLYRSGDNIILPHLRCVKRKNYTERRPYTRNKVIGNRIVDMGKMEELVNLYNAGHRKHNGRKMCKGTCKFSKNLEQKVGLGCKEALRCTTCGYKTTPAELFQRADTRRPGARGPLAAKLNIQAVTPGAKDRYGPSALIPLFASLNIPDPSRTTLQKKQNMACEAYKQLNEEQMKKNCAMLKEVKRLRIEAGLRERETVATESDVGYNNPPKGKSRGQPATQAECPLFEHETDKKMLLSLTTESQHCAECEVRAREGLPTGPDSHPNCTQTFDKNVKMGSSERKMAKKNTEKILQSGLVPDTSCSDNDGKIINGTNDALRDAGLPPAEKQDCLQHNRRNHRHRVFNLGLEVFEGGNNDKNSRMKASRKVGHYIVKRCTSALYAARGHHPDSDTDFFAEVEQVRQTIVNCISGEHSSCSFEFGCPEYIPYSGRPAPEIPGGGNLALTVADRKTLQDLVDYRLAPETVKRQRKLMTTNKSEAFHNRALKAVPKALTFKRNYAPRVPGWMVWGV